MILLLALLGCNKEIPPHLQVDRPLTSTEHAAPPQSLSALVRSDPLVRRPDPRAPGAWLKLQNGPALEAWATMARRTAATPSDWTQLERSHPGTSVVALARGARLAALEVSMADTMDEAAQQHAAAWLGATRVEVRPTTDKPRLPLDWIPGTTMADKRQAALTISERAVLLGWLQGPEIDILPTATALTSPAHTRLRDTPAGIILVTRAAGERSPESGKVGKSALLEATVLALATVAADRDTEQDALRARLDAAATRLGGKTDPVATWLHRARIALSADAADDSAAGLALVALTGERLLGHCPDTPCIGLSRTRTLKEAGGWGADVLPFALAWEVVALKQAVDTLQASHKKPSFGHTLIEVVEPLSGTGGGPIALSLLRYRVAEPTALLQISRLARGPASTDPAEVIAVLQAHLVEVCDQAIAAGPPAEISRLVRRIRHRALRP